MLKTVGMVEMVEIPSLAQVEREEMVETLKLAPEGMVEMGEIASLEGVVMEATAVMEPQVAAKEVLVARDFY
jgi:hypothetical protein